MSENTLQKTEAPQVAHKPSVPMGVNGLECRTMDEAWRFAGMLSESSFVPDTYRGKPGDCLVAIDMAQRLHVAPLMFLQNTYIVHGKPGMESKLIITLINQSGLFTDPLDYEVKGDHPHDDKYKVRAVATRRSTGKQLFGPWITWELVRAEKWNEKKGSKWPTMPEIMFHYRAASWFANRHCPEVKMGMMSADEIYDEGPAVESGRKSIKADMLEPTKGRKPMRPKEEPEKKPDTPETTHASLKTETPQQTELEVPEFKYTCKACQLKFDDPDDSNGKAACPKCATEI